VSKLLDIRKRIASKNRNRKNDDKIEIRDSREREFFIVDDRFMDVYARICGVYATCVYLALCRHVGKDQTCWPSINLLSEKLGMTTRSVIRSTKVLEHHKIIQIDKVKGDSNIYTLLNKRHWKKEKNVLIYHRYVGVPSRFV
jgi:hypothetical protein